MRRQEHNIQILKLLAALMVISIHIASPYVIRYEDNPAGRFTVANLYFSLTVVCVPLFVMISGGFLLADDRNAEWASFLSRKFRSIVLPLLVWNAFYILYPIAIDIAGYLAVGSPLDYSRPDAIAQRLLAWLLGESDTHLWYMYMLLGLYAITPWLVRLRRRYGDRLLAFVAIAGTALAAPLVYVRHLTWVPARAVWFVGYFAMGYTLKHTKRINPSAGICLSVYLVASLTVFGLTEYLAHTRAWASPRFFYSYQNPLVALATIGLYWLFLQVQIAPTNLLLPIARHTTTIYFAHMFMLDMVASRLLAKRNIEPHPIWFVPALALATLLASYGIGLALERALLVVQRQRST